MFLIQLFGIMNTFLFQNIQMKNQLWPDTCLKHLSSRLNKYVNLYRMRSIHKKANVNMYL